MCRDREASLAHQLGALATSMAYKADIPNFLEPWYGIGTLASAFGIDYVWPEHQAPVVPHAFISIQEALDHPAVAVEETAIGRHTLGMIDYFVNATHGRLPISLTDTQSPLNALSFLVESNSFYMSFLDAPEALARMLDRLVPLQIAFVRSKWRSSRHDRLARPRVRQHQVLLRPGYERRHHDPPGPGPIQGIRCAKAGPMR